MFSNFNISQSEQRLKNSQISQIIAKSDIIKSRL